jgi:predicted nucleic acid-binding protein
VIQNRLQRETNTYNAQHHTNLSAEQFRQQNPSIIKNFLSEINNVRRKIETVCEILLPETSVTNLAFDIINKYYLRPTDAYHIAVAKSYGITSFAAIDRDFLRVDGIEVFTCLPP